MSKRRKSPSSSTDPAPDFPSYQAPKSKKHKAHHSDGVKNFYDIMNQEKKYQTEKFHYENEDNIHIEVPFMMTISGKTGSGKTNAVMDIITNINCWEKIFLCAKDPEEPLYKWFTDKVREVEKKTGSSILTVVDNVAKIPVVDDFIKNRDPKRQILFIFDDLITEKDKLLNRVTEFFIRGRKVFASCMFLSQSYYATPSKIRKQCGYIVLKHIAQESDLKRIISDYDGVEVSFETLSRLYHHAIDSGEMNFFMIDLVTKDDNLKFRINYTGIPASQWKESGTPHSPSYDKDD